VYDYEGGKLDWMAAGLPTEGKNSQQPRAGELSRKDVPTATLNEKLGAVRQRVQQAGFDAAVVVNDQRIVLGLLRSEELKQDGEVTVEKAMRPGPSTFRPYVSAREMAEFMTGHDIDCSPITTSDGKLVGLLLQSDALAAAEDETC